MIVKAIYHGPTDEVTEQFVDGKTYEVLFMYVDVPYYVIIDGEGDKCMCEKSALTLINATDEDLDWYETDQETLEDVLVRKANSK